ncbi:MAG TPA: glycoside hydrolase family protein [Brevundimonas sp.]|nr:glycoside hydrolase family protein [Brevundimonas sp.]
MSDATTPRLKVSREGIVLIKSFEGFRPRAVRDEDGGWVIGYGHRASARDGLTVSEQDGELLLQYDLLPVVKALNEQVSARLNQHQFDAMASFAISVGVDRFLASDVLRRLNEGEPGAAADALIGWPEHTPPDARLRRRAAERALFVADPATPVHLADLLAAPLPPPAVEESSGSDPAEAPVLRPDFSAHSNTRAAAVARLLGEAPATAEPTPPDAAEPSAPPAPAPFEPARLQTAPPVTTIHLQRYSPYAAAIIGPLPGFPTATPKTPAEAGAETGVQAGTEVGVEALVEAPTAAGSRPRAPEPEPAVEIIAAEEPSTRVVPLIPPEPAASPFPPIDPPLVLTPPTEVDFAETGRPVWGPEDRAEAALSEGEVVLFDDEPGLAVLRHEIQPAAPRRFDWSETGAFLIMGLIGLAACAFSAASFRKAMREEDFLGDFTLIGWVLALIGVACVGVSSWYLYRRWTRRD